MLGSSTVSNGSASLVVATLPAGTHSVTATYSGDTNFLQNTSPALQQTVQPRTTSITLTAAPNPSMFGGTVTLTAKVLPPSAPGSVTFYDGSTSLGVVPLTNGTAALSTSALAVGTHSLTAMYPGTVDFLPSTSSMVNEVVRKRATY